MAEKVDVLGLFVQAAFEVNGKNLEGVTLDTVIADVGLDSIDVMELVSYFEEKLAIRIPDEDLANVRTLADFAALVERLVPANGR